MLFENFILIHNNYLFINLPFPLTLMFEEHVILKLLKVDFRIQINWLMLLNFIFDSYYFFKPIYVNYEVFKLIGMMDNLKEFI